MYPNEPYRVVVLLQETKGVIRDDRGHLIHNLSHPQAMAPDHVRGRRPGHPKRRYHHRVHISSLLAYLLSVATPVVTDPLFDIDISQKDKQKKTKHRSHISELELEVRRGRDGSYPCALRTRSTISLIRRRQG